MTMCNVFQWIILIFIMCFADKGGSLKCYECDNGQNPACGVDFKSYQYEARVCTSSNVKCGLQRQLPLFHKSQGTFIGVIRLCYQLGSLRGINETNGCRYWTSPENFTALYCFCSTDYCNGTISEARFPVILCVGLLIAYLVHLIES
ncbi:hypothetical protein CHS0354_031818 [Potamilus streckersoni]|uniref:Protein sleepless n=1 Tax=Potamilus streckersoni TaxID=2493646 RepID=A0AAE0RY61_9BIVA|nr:hypothetical protein CHS0354_031818 [Potamilus streckersoni]